jgi:hypothetical protein
MFWLLIDEVYRSHTTTHTVGSTPLDEWSARRRDLYLTTHNRQTSMPPVGFEPTISKGERPQTYALERAATGNGTSTIGTGLKPVKYIHSQEQVLLVHILKLERLNN